MREVFIGVVSHASSRFLDSTGPHGLARQIARRLNSPTTHVAVQVNTEDAWSASVLELTDAVVSASCQAQLDVEGRWQHYLGGRPDRRLRKAVELLVRRMRRVDPDGGRRAIRRLLNIELSHRALLQAGVDSGADWVVILEDDAGSDHPDECAMGLLGILEAASTRDQPAYINLSESFTPRALGIDHLLAEVPGVVWSADRRRKVLAAQRPVTNTVCAIAYRAAFARTLSQRLASAPVSPVIPIDWKLNDILMAMHAQGTLGAGDCWLVEPAPIAQLSMRRPAAPGTGDRETGASPAS